MSKKLSSELDEFVSRGRVVYNPDVPDFSKYADSIRKTKEFKEWLNKTGVPVLLSSWKEQRQ